MDSAKQNALADTVNLSGSSLRARLEEIDTEIAALEARLGHLKTAREPVAIALDSIVYPILSIPVEITSLIFSYGSWIVDFNDMKRKGPLFLAQICRAWREIVFNTPSMWSRVRAAIDSLTKPLPVKWPDLLQSWLARSGNQPLYLNLLAGNNMVEAEPLCTIAADYSKQWRSFSCSLNDSVCSAIDRIQGHTPFLHELILESEPGFSTPLPITAFSVAPELRKVELYSLPPACIALSWGQLTHLILYRQTLELLGGRNWTQDFYPYVTLPHLTDLRITVHSGIDGLPAFLTRSRCTVEKFSLDASADLFVVLPFFDQVRELIFTYVDHWWHNLAQLFLRIATDAMFLPRLQSFDVLQYFDTIPYKEMVQMLCARRFDRDSKPKLASFQMIRNLPEVDAPYYSGLRYRADYVPDTAIEDQLEALVADGLELRIDSWHMMDSPFYTETLSSLGRA
ncbi:F-box domain-containing protein [Favolaschia claudopus]|uniref:F-box domain-containing protein n=1 Tax=Favolaschia claudopus TaxID=2862362 RepID=A0AAV9Z2B5_9AGAR